jgi:O-antigen/teichoic acid export membrane protein
MQLAPPRASEDTADAVARSLGAKLASASAWSALAELASKAVTPAVLLVLASILEVQDFGITGIAAAIIAFCQMFWEAGLVSALINRDTQVGEAANGVFWTNLALGALLCAAIWCGAERADDYFGDPRLAPVLRVQCIQVMIGASVATHVAMLKRALDFRTLFWVRFPTIVVPGLASAPLALAGYGYWALVVGSLLGATAQLPIVWLVCPWRPRLHYPRSIVAEMLRYGIWATTESFLGWVHLWFDSVLVALWLGQRELGLYRISNNFALMIFTVLLSPIIPVLFTTFSRLRDDLERFRRASLKTGKAIAMITLPVAVGGFLVRQSLAGALFDARWLGIESALGIITLTEGLAWTVGGNAEAFRAIGRPDLNTKLLLLYVSLFVGLCVLVIPLGLESFLWAKLGLCLSALPLHMVLVARIIGVPITKQLSALAGSAVATLVMATVLVVVENSFSAIAHPWMRLGFLVITGAGVYGLTLLLLERDFLISLQQLGTRWRAAVGHRF